VLKFSLNGGSLPTASSYQSQSYVTTDGQSASLYWNKAPTWGLRPDFYSCQTVASLLMWGALSDERMGLSFTIAAGPRQRSPVGLATVFDSLRLKTSLFVASYDSQDYGGGIRPHGPSRKHRFQQCLNWYMRIRCRWNVFTEPLPRNGSTRCNMMAYRYWIGKDFEGEGYRLIEYPGVSMCDLQDLQQV
jgi:hypothetical protein